ncbi:heat shock 70 kDa protein 12A-like [Mercenaria mercenaria]|uniref:heat shock 70 kDa protein 12A-like n=1 Tax=Mercenaria mercenaria TaxID=6596 RepID=UPI00234F650C|nr:heat shock 70 kDa protein 12A-like [Mercenaria mercenaria]
MWKMRSLSPSVRLHVIFVSDEEGNHYSFPVERGNFTLDLLRLTFPMVRGLDYHDVFQGKKGVTKHVQLKKSVFIEPEGGWFAEGRKYFIRREPRRRSNIFAVEMLKRYRALTQGVTLYFDPVEEPTNVTAAIDFGTSFSGYAYSFAWDPYTIYTNDWLGEGMAVPTEKAPTTVLLYPDGRFHSFGYDAEDEYALLVDGEVFHDWYYFRNFKMKLYSNKDLRRESVLRDTDGKQRKALTIFSMAIAHLRKRLIQDVQSRNRHVHVGDISWVLTVPAIWSDAAKQFMREAAVNAGIRSENLKLVLEPEAASLYCKTLDESEIHVISGTKKDNPLARGKRYILLDLGGGTADMSAHEILVDGSLKEIHRATGDALGGNTVDECFNRTMSEIVGPENMLDFFQDYRQDFVNFMREFESKKRMPLSDVSNVVFKLPASLCNIVHEKSKRTMEEAIQASPYASQIKINGDKLMFTGDMMRKLYQGTVDGIVSYIKQMKANPRLADVHTIVLAGGFSKCDLVTDAIMDSFPEDLILCPSDPGIAILKGAVLMGQRPETIVERVARYTYGVSYARKPFYEGEDPDELKATRNGETYCDDVFEKLVEIGQPIRVTDVFTVHRTSYLKSSRSKQRRLYTKLYASIETDPEYCTEECFCVKIGEIIRHPPEHGWPDVMRSKIEIKFGETEMNVRIFEKMSGVEYKARIDAL